MTRKLSDLLPDEWRSALSSSRRLFEVVHRSDAPFSKVLVGFGLPVLLGLAFYMAVRPTLSAFAISASMTVIGLMAGFLMNLMLSTGKVDSLEDVDYDTSTLVIDKLRHLLWSLTLTFLSYVATLAVGIALIAETASRTPEPSSPETILSQVFTALFVGGLVLVFVRSFFLPLQIVELHQFQFDELLQSKKKAKTKSLQERRKAARKSLSDE